MNVRYREWTAEDDAPAPVLSLDHGARLANRMVPTRPRRTLAERAPSLIVVIAIHGFLAWLIVQATMSTKPPIVEKIITVTIDAADAKPSPPVPQPMVPMVPKLVQIAPPPDIATPTIQIAAATPPPVQMASAAPPAPPSPPAQKTPAEPEVIPPSYDADYLKNPLPVYPNMSRRLRETGTVQMRVRVSADGQPLEIQLANSSGYPRLDDAAREAVKKWRFQPAMRAGKPVEAWVLFPLEFSLGH
jgi:protein TonB